MYVFNCAPEMDYRTMGDIFKVGAYTRPLFSST